MCLSVCMFDIEFLGGGGGMWESMNIRVWG